MMRRAISPRFATRTLVIERVEFSGFMAPQKWVISAQRIPTCDQTFKDAVWQHALEPNGQPLQRRGYRDIQRGASLAEQFENGLAHVGGILGMGDFSIDRLANRFKPGVLRVVGLSHPQTVGVDGGFEIAGPEYGDPNTMPGELHALRFGDELYGCLGGAVYPSKWEAYDPCDAADVHQVPSRSDEVRGGHFAHRMEPHHIGAVYGQQFFFGRVAHGAHHANAGVVDDSIDAAFGIHDRGHGGSHGLGLGDIECDRARSAGLRWHCGGTSSGAPNAVAMVGQYLSDGGADAGGGTGNEDNLGVAVEVGSHGKKRGQAIPIAPLRPPALAAFRPWGVEWELAVGDLPSVDKGRPGEVPLYVSVVDIGPLAPIMNTTANLPGDPVAPSGLIPSKLFGHALAGAGLILAGYAMAFLVNFEWLLGGWTTPFVLTVVVAVMVMVLLTVRQDEGKLAFGRAFGLSLLAGFLARLGYNLFNLLLFQVVRPDLLDAYVALVIEKAEEALAAFNLETLSSDVDGFGTLLETSTRYSLTLTGQCTDALTSIVWLALVALIVSAVLKRGAQPDGTFNG